MAKQLGFIVIEMGAQFVGNTVTDDQLKEVRNELGFGDLHRGTGPALRVRDRLKGQLGPYMNEFADSWTRTTADPELSDLLSQLRNKLSRDERASLLNTARSINRTNGNRGGW